MIRSTLANARSSRERVAAILVHLSRTVPGTGVLLWLICGADIPRAVEIGDRVRFPHGARGVVIHPRSRIGSGAVIYHGVTLASHRHNGDAPTVSDDVIIGTGAVILGNVTLGRGCQIGANAVVTHDIPAHCVAAGVPARVIRT